MSRVLLVEDSANDVDLALAAFDEAELGLDVVVVADGQEALDYLRREGLHGTAAGPLPECVLLDVKLPRVDGHEVLAAMKADARLKDIPVVMLTSSDEASDVKKSYDLGANAYVVKPIGFDAYTAALQGIGRFWGTINRTTLGPQTTGG